MLTFAPLDLQAIDEVSTAITYYKLFPYIVQDFLTRYDSKAMMSSENLSVLVNPGQAVNVVVPAGTGSTVSPGMGQVNPAYNGGFKREETIAYEQQVKAAKEAGSLTVNDAKNAIVG